MDNVAVSKTAQSSDVSVCCHMDDASSKTLILAFKDATILTKSLQNVQWNVS